MCHGLIGNAGENCGFLKTECQLLEEPLTFEDGAIVLQPGYEARLNKKHLRRHAVAHEVFAPMSVAAE